MDWHLYKETDLSRDNVYLIKIQVSNKFDFGLEGFLENLQKILV